LHHVVGHRDFSQRCAAIARHRQTAHKQLVIAFLQRIRCDGAGSEGDRVARPPGGQHGNCGLPQPRLPGRGQAVTLDDEPGVERRAAGQVQALEQLAVQLEELGRISLISDQGAGVYHDVRTYRANERIAFESDGIANAAPQFGQSPAKGAQRIVGVAEQHLG
jgi:hypothetical protein